ncbi:MAG: methyltransferase domain-containing protein [Actinomycetota bacterium]|nr:methyltransferase domain-containing protein [Actinomycetota bacterium]
MTFDTPSPAANRWRAELAAWAIPEHILARAPESPWGFPVELFRVEEPSQVDTPSRRRALEALPEGGSVLDVGCGGGAAAFALAARAGRLTGVDSDTELLEQFATTAERMGIDHREVFGSWPEAADQVEGADVAVCHHVAYNVADLPAFAGALSRRARHRVVLELTDRHPMVSTGPLWQRFHGIDRPDGPTAELAAEVLAEAGIEATVERFARPPREAPRSAIVTMTRRRLCLPADREPEVDAAMGPIPSFPPGGATCLWWDTNGTR